MKKLQLFLTGILFVLLSSGISSAAPFQNGSFEEGPSPADYMTLYSDDPVGSIAITGWKVESGSIDLIGTYWQAADGERSIDLNGLVPGAISQTFDTIPGKQYLVQFDMAGNPDGGPAVTKLLASVGPPNMDKLAYEFTFDSTEKSRTNMGWTPEFFAFEARDTSTTIEFVSETDGSYGPAIDNVVVQLRPFPEDTMPPTGAVHAYPNLLWSPNNKLVTVTLEGYVVDELSIARDGGGTGVSAAGLVVDGKLIILKYGTVNLLDENGRFSVTTQLRAVKGATYTVQLFARDTTAGSEGQNFGLVDTTYVSVPHDMSGDKPDNGDKDKDKDKDKNKD